MTPPSGVRFRVLLLLCVLAMITYMDRAANGSARDAIMADLNRDLPADATKYDKNDFFLVLMAFQLAYALFEIPSGWLGDTRGPRTTLLRVVLWWSAFVALTGFTGSNMLGVYIGFGGLIALQFLFGVGEAGAFPNIAKALYNWFPATDRGFAKSAVWMCARCMGGLTPCLWVLLTSDKFGGYGWREAMWLFAAVAGIWCVVFYVSFRNTPAEHPGVNAAERELIAHNRVPAVKHVVVPWAKLAASRNLWAVCVMYVVTNFCWYFLMYNHPGMMKKEYASWNDTPGGQVSLALVSGAPLLVGMFGCLLGGLFSDNYLKRTGDRTWARRLPGMVGYAGAGLCYFAAAGVKYYDPANLWLFAGLLVLMGFMNDLIMAPAWAVCQDIGREYAATVSGAMNMFGNLVGAVSGILITGLIEKNYPDEKILICFTMYGCVYFLGVLAWLFIDAAKPAVQDDTVSVS